MAFSAAVSVASFSVVLAETFAAVGLSTVVPAAAVTLARIAANQSNANDLATKLGNTPAAGMTDLIRALPGAMTSLDMLLPKTAKIHAEFAFEGSEAVSGTGAAGGGATIDSLAAVSVGVGYSALYQAQSSNKITLDIEFVSVNVPIAPAAPSPMPPVIPANPTP